MKLIRIFLALCFSAGAARTALAAPEVNVTCVNEKPTEVLQLYVSLSRKKVNVPGEINKVTARINVTIRGKPQDRAARIVEQALLTQAHIELVPESDGSVTAHIVPEGN